MSVSARGERQNSPFWLALSEDLCLKKEVDVEGISIQVVKQGRKESASGTLLRRTNSVSQP
jgi:hypothetical protein